MAERGGAGRRSATTMIVGQLIGQLSLVVAIPILTRIFTPAEMGVYQIATAVALILQPLASLRLEFYIPLVPDQHVLRRYIRIGYLSTSAVALVAAIVGLLLLSTGNATAAETATMVGFIIAAYAWMNLDNARLIRTGEHGRLALRNAVSGLLAAGLQLVAAVFLHSVLALAIAILIGRAISILATRPRSGGVAASQTGTSAPALTPRRIALAVGSGVVWTASMQAITIVSGATFGTAASGYVGVAQRVAGAPIALIGQALSQIVQGGAAAAIRANKPTVALILRKQVVRLGGVAVLMAVGLIVLAPLLAVPVFGPGWETAGTVTAILAVPMSLQLIVAPITPLLPMLAREGLLFSLQLMRLLLVVVVCGAMIASGAGLIATCIAFAIVTTVAYAIMVSVLLVVARGHDRRIVEACE
ncbi:oligosaccharide flippase family protein [Plantibacter cousiniae (nom. nud.)]|uniref:oligosaccharide flippase family protein n=1 Tax=Plantibacter cousiniae (nom. nud.) TaxID=199709 RepID=UPI001E29C3D6|nr:oligosaccharide flippase family protein [Plantibacter cousiniae]